MGKPARRLDADLDVTGMAAGKATYILTALPNGATRLEARQTYIFENWLAKLLTPVIVSAAQSKLLEAIWPG